jgi:hypothetical protein
MMALPHCGPVMLHKHYYRSIMDIADVKVGVLGRREMEYLDGIRMLKH